MTQANIEFARHSFEAGDSNCGEPAGLAHLYPVVDSADWIARLLPMGIRTVQLRIKQGDPCELEREICRAIALGREHNACVFINDYWQLALKHGAYGVHLGQTDMPKADLSGIATAGMRLGVSTRTADELITAIRMRPSYLAIGHIFPTPTKQMSTPPQGLATLKQHVQTVAGGIPTVAIGGIDLGRAADVWQTCVDAVAVVRAVTESRDLTDDLARFNTLLARRKEVVCD
ncbi:thiamine phosphate synthase [Shewanella submarina]|uniref:Thiamine-phosphate synthase n=1 Tax=Shewanella submarina TaxID=2016376 RepID=A0ABV7GBR6_9GAMM|nr:thiamine phosphate synthase [Shewanella submarina]MCL1038898.1 thiamine phosphate synthase [Shewanella submarina]